ncbi:unnamed protein product [Oppiella nova]|uniref:Fibronectin type-III domain-containing protein n=1 Tax=Oppiella nova TaxID=334625 RepID=A0A7R9QHA6_9ACAR|nr:unnamed protein product [Oppiella nova]CAG2165931.1 unnamed protein product [Oppiella nova]
MKRKLNVVKALTESQIGLIRSPYRQSLEIMHSLIRNKSTKFERIWSETSKQPIVYDDSRIYFNNYTHCLALCGKDSLPSTLYRLQKNTKIKRFEDVFMHTGPVSCTPLPREDYRPYFLALTSDNWLIRYDNSPDGKDELRVQWNPTTGSGKKPGSYFYVQYRLKGSERFLNTPKDENQDSLIVPIRGLEEDKTYEIRVVAVDGQFETPSETQEISSSGGPGADSTAHLANFAPWFIGMMCAIALIIVLVVLVCIVKRNRGGKYSVHEKEAAQGREDYEEGGFNEYNKPLGGAGGPHHRGSRQSLNISDVVRLSLCLSYRLMPLPLSSFKPLLPRK